MSNSWQDEKCLTCVFRRVVSLYFPDGKKLTMHWCVMIEEYTETEFGACDLWRLQRGLA